MVVAFSKNRRDSGQITEEASDEKWRRRGLGYEGEVLLWRIWTLGRKVSTYEENGKPQFFLAKERSYKSITPIVAASWMGDDGDRERYKFLKNRIHSFTPYGKMREINHNYKSKVVNEREQ